MLNYSMGTVARIGDLEYLATEVGRKGHALYGPYSPVQPGKWVVEFSLGWPLRIGAELYAGAAIEVTSEFGKSKIALDFVGLPELGAEPRTIPLAFDLSEERILEFRVYTIGHASLLIGDNPKLRPRGPEETLVVRAADQNSKALFRLFLQGVKLRIDRERVSINIDRSDAAALFRLDEDSTDELAREIAETVGFKGDHENALYRAFIGSETSAISPPQPIPFTSTLCQQAHFGYDQYRFWARALKDRPKFYRKQWEFVFIAQVLFERGFLAPGKRGLVFGAGQEPLPALFASFGVSILATDQTAEDAERSGWAASNQHTFNLETLNRRGICTDFVFKEHVSYMTVDMNDIPPSLDGSFDFCWSACALEHLGSLEHGASFIENSLKTLRSGGLCVHTTEFNLTSNTRTLESPGCSFYRRCDIEKIIERLERGGYKISPIDWTSGQGFAERVVDFPPYGRGEPHIRLRSHNYDVTSIGLIIERP